MNKFQNEFEPYYRTGFYYYYTGEAPSPVLFEWPDDEDEKLEIITDDPHLHNQWIFSNEHRYGLSTAEFIKENDRKFYNKYRILIDG